jgi:hypothetical protein
LDIRSAVGFVVAVAFAIACAIAVVIYNPLAPPADIPVAVMQRAQCMYDVLKTIPGINEPKLGYVTNAEWNHPFVEYLAAEGGRVSQIRFEAEKPRPDHLGYWFLTSFVGGIPSDLDLGLMEFIMHKWKTQCHTDADWEIN